MVADAWLVDSVVASLFTPAGLPLHAFRDLVGSEPSDAHSVVTPLGRPMYGGTPRVTAAGAYSDAWLWLAESAPRGRVQLALTSPPLGQAGDDAEWPRHIGELGTRLAQLQDLTLGLVQMLGPTMLWRIGLGVSLLWPVPDMAEGYRWLRRYLPTVRLDTMGPTDVDFEFRINRPVGPTPQAPPAHRLRTFSVVSLRRPSAPPSSADAVACRLEVDVSTVQSHPLNSMRHDFREILSNFRAWAIEIASHGDVQ